MSCSASPASPPSRIVSYLGSGEIPRRSGGRDSVIAVYQAFDTADEPITLGLANDRTFRRFREVAERPEWVDVPDYADNRVRRAPRPELVEKIQAVLRTRGRAELLAAFEAAGVPAGPINTVADVAEDADLLERGLLSRFPTAPGRRSLRSGPDACSTAPERRRQRPAAARRRHSRRVLARWAQLPAGRVEDLRRDGVA